MMSERTRERGQTILEIFAEGQNAAPSMRNDRETDLLLSIKRRKNEDNVAQHARLKANPVTRAARAKAKRDAYAVKRGGKVRAYKKAAA